MPRKAACHGQPVRRPAIVRIAGAAVLLALLGGCEAIYDDTKGWANRVEASFLKKMHELAEPEPEPGPGPDAAPADAEPALAEAKPASEAPPAVPVTPVDTARLPELPATPDQTPALSAPAGPARHAPEGLMAATADGLLAPAAEPAPGEAEKAPMAEAAKTPAPEAAAGETKTAALPPKPLPKPERAPPPRAPEVPAAAPSGSPEKPAEKNMAEAAKAPSGAPPAADADVAMVLHLSSLRSEEAAKREWSDLQRSFPDSLGQMGADIQRAELGDKGVYYRVLAGPLPSRKAASQTCEELKAKDAKQYCRVLPSQPPS